MPRRRQSLDRAAVVDAAIALVEQDGIGALGINRVARSLGIKPPSLYNHISGGADLAWYVARTGWHRMGVQLDASPIVGDPTVDLAELCNVYRDFARSNPHLYEVMSTTPLRNDDPEYAPRMRASLALFSAQITALGATDDDAIHAMRALRSAMHGFIVLEIGGQFALDQTASDSWRWMVAAVIGNI